MLRETVAAATPADEVPDTGRDAELTAVLRAHTREGRITEIPAQRTRRTVLLDHVARSFDPGVHSTEPEVDALLHAFHDDHAMLRRHLVDEGSLDRSAGHYRRSGGTVPDL